MRATASSVRFPGFRQLYEEQKDGPESDEDKISAIPLPELNANDELALRALRPEQHFTEPPPRYTEATLVKGLEENGIGRPSTYAPIMSTIQDRGYVEREGRQLKPTELGFVVNDFLIDQFPQLFSSEGEVRSFLNRAFKCESSGGSWYITDHRTEVLASDWFTRRL